MDFVSLLANEYLNRTKEPKKVTKSYVVEPIYNGQVCIIHKKDNKVKIYSNDIDTTLIYNKQIDSLININNQDYIVKGTFVYLLNNKIIPFKDILVSLNSNNKVYDTVKIYLSDIMYYNKDISNLSWVDRHKYLNKFSYTTTIKLLASNVVTDKSKLKDTVNFINNLDNSNGVSIKDYKSTYINANSEYDELVFIKS